MKIRFYFLLATSFLLFFAVPPPVESAQGPPSPFLRLGTAKTEITPPVGTPLAGFGKRHGRPSTGIHDPLYGRALALNRGEERLVLISADLVLIDEKLRNEVLKKIRRKKTIRDEELVLAATHTHSGAGAIGGRLWERFIMGKFRKKVFQDITDSLAQAALEAMGQGVPVTAEYGETAVDDLVENRMDEKQKFPHRIRMLRFKDESGKVLGACVFMAAHPTLLPASNDAFSADFPGALTRRLEEKAPGSVALFINGAAADLRPKAAGIENRFDRMEAYANALDERIQKISFSPVALEGPWQGAGERIKLPRVRIREGWLRVPSFVGNRIFPRKTFFQAVRMGRFMVLTFPGELDSETGWHLENQMRARGFETLLAGYANDYIAYVVPRRYYPDLNQYESQVSFYGPKMEWFVQKEALRLSQRVLLDEERKNLYKPAQLEDHEGQPVLKLRGEAYWLGFEEGRNFKNEIRDEVKEIFRYLRSEVPAPLVNRLLINVYLDHAWKKMEPFVTYEEFLQMHGVADGAGISFKTIRRVHALPEIFPAWCSNGAYWGKATQGGRLIAIRNLDWNRQIGVHRYPAVKIISTSGRKSYANIGYQGFIGVLSGMNERGISVGEVGASSKDETLEGVPMPFLLKRVLEESGSTDDAVEIFRRSSLTRGYQYVIADAKNQKALALETTRSHLAVFGDQDPGEASVGYALRVENAVFRGDPALDPEIRNLQTAAGGEPEKPGLETPVGSSYEIRYKKHGELILKNYGRITPETAEAMALEISPGSNIQSVIYDFPDFWVANARDNLRATESGYVHLNFEELTEDERK